MGSRKQAGQLTSEFAETVIAQNEAILNGDAAKGNRHARKRRDLFNAVRALGDPGRDALCALLQHDRPDVRAMAACYLLRYRHAESMAVLREVSRMPGLAGFGAGECIKRWEEGAWELDPES
jgi:hypothetical protein